MTRSVSLKRSWPNDQEKNVSVSGCHSPWTIAAQISSRFTRVISEAAYEELRYTMVGR